MRLKTLTRIVTLASAATLAVAVTPDAALAQSAPRFTFMPPSASPAPAARITQTQADSSWEVIGGLEFDTDGMMYGFFGPQWSRPLNDNVKLTARAYANWLQYEFDESGGTTKVSGPGISTQLGLKFGSGNTFKVGAGPSFKWRKEKFVDGNGVQTDILDADGDGDKDGMEVGFSVGADAYINPTKQDNIHALVNYETIDGYLWSRLGYKHQISNLDWKNTWAHFAGAEGIWQGNDDIKTLMIGALLEFVHAPSSTAIMVRGGVKKSSFDTADDRTGPYVGINFYKKLGR